MCGRSDCSRPYRTNTSELTITRLGVSGFKTARGAYIRLRNEIPGMAAYGPCIKAGEFLLPSGLMALGRDGHVVGKTISPGFAGLAHAGFSQAAAIYDYAEALCQAAGTSMANVLRAQYFVSDIAAFPGIAMAWSGRFGRQPHPFVCVQTPPTMPAPGAAVIADFWISTLP